MFVPVEQIIAAKRKPDGISLISELRVIDSTTYDVNENTKSETVNLK